MSRLSRLLPGRSSAAQNNLERAGFEQRTSSFRWARDVEGFTVAIEFSARHGYFNLEVELERLETAATEMTEEEMIDALDDE